MEPLRKGRYRLAMPIAKDKELESRIHGHFGGSPYYILMDMDVKEEVIKWRAIENPELS